MFSACWVMVFVLPPRGYSLLFSRFASARSIHDLRIPTCAIPNKAPKQVKHPAELFQHLKSGQNVFIQGGAMTPTFLITHLYRYAIDKGLTNIKTVHIHTEGEFPVTEESVKNHFRSTSLFTGGNCRKAIASGHGDYVPVFLHEIPKLFRRRIIPLHYALINISPPDHHGFCSIGCSVDVTRSALESAAVIVAQINPYVPLCKGDAEIHISNIDYTIDGPMPLHELPAKPSTLQEKKIAELIANELVADEATLQTGIGSIPDSVLALLKNHKNLGVHTELFSDGLVDLFKSGAVTNAKKHLFPGKIVSSFVIGSKKSFDFVNANNGIDLRDIAWTNNPSNIAQNPRPTAINSCIEVDITGQIVSDSIGSQIYSGFGGQVDFLRGAAIASDGLGVPIIALASTTKKGQSKIVPYLRKGAGVVTTRAHAHYVVTEHGIAYLFGKSLRQRAYELIRIADPVHREQLEKDAYEMLKVMPSSD
ncbi:4-hydroxybutyrate coenzyme A transferase [Taenia solium]|eukprot:TsM_000923300 transcript=TsM_000923300 gene=TsM_000923300